MNRNRNRFTEEYLAILALGLGTSMILSYSQWSKKVEPFCKIWKRKFWEPL